MITHYWATEESIEDNSGTMIDFLDHELPLICRDYECIWVDGSQAEVQIDGKFYICDVSGNGDTYHHKVEFSESEE